jgi:hypothetical protein
MSAPAAAPTRIAASRPASLEPLESATANPKNAPAYIVPSIPRFSTPARSLYVSPTVP